jgi:cytoskeletal protein RodZ
VTNGAENPPGDGSRPGRPDGDVEPAAGRFGGRRHRPPTAIEAGPRLGDVLLTARERKGVDLYRAERDTKIRARYLGALERGDYAELPGSVYTKGFLRNYAQYLGLDPEATLQHYHRESGAARGPEQPSIVPRALEAPRSRFTLTPGLAVGAILVLAIIAFAVYIVLQLFRFAKPPTLVITNPPTFVSEIADVDRTVITGTSEAGVTITIRGAVQQPYRVTADGTGAWQKEVPLTKGRNEFTVTATDPTTAKDSAPVTLVITVPIPVSQAPTLTVTSPNEGAAFANASVPVQGRTNASSVKVSAKYLAAAPASSAPSTAKATSKPTARPTAPATPATRTVKVSSDGTFNDSYQLAAGRWTVTISATGQNQRTTTEARTVTVTFTGVNVTVELSARTWIKVWVDGKIDPGVGAEGQTIAASKTLVFAGRRSVEVRTESSGATLFTLNGVSLGALGASGAAETWLFAPSTAPKSTDRR